MDSTITDLIGHYVYNLQLKLWTHNQWKPWDWMCTVQSWTQSPMDTVTFLELLSHRDCSKGHSSQHQTSLKTELVKEQLKPLARKDCSTSA